MIPNLTTAGSSTTDLGMAETFTVGSHPWGVAIGDINGDGLNDIVTANNGSGNVSVLVTRRRPG